MGLTGVLTEGLTWQLELHKPCMLSPTYIQEVRVARTAGTLVADIHACVHATLRARSMGGSRIATLIMPHDLTWQPSIHTPMQPPTPTLRKASTHPPPAVNTFLSQCAAALVAAGPKGAMLLGRDALYGPGLAAAGRIADATGVVLLAENAFARADRGAGHPAIQVCCGGVVFCLSLIHTHTHSVWHIFLMLPVLSSTAMTCWWSWVPVCLCLCLATSM